MAENRQRETANSKGAPRTAALVDGCRAGVPHRQETLLTGRRSALRAASRSASRPHDRHNGMRS
jgi:hypothetical protein